MSRRAHWVRGPACAKKIRAHFSFPKRARSLRAHPSLSASPSDDLWSMSAIRRNCVRTDLFEDSL